MINVDYKKNYYTHSHRWSVYFHNTKTGLKWTVLTNDDTLIADAFHSTDPEVSLKAKAELIEKTEQK